MRPARRERWFVRWILGDWLRHSILVGLRSLFQAVIAGLDPAIHPLLKRAFVLMDARVKPAHDEGRLITLYRFQRADFQKGEGLLTQHLYDW
jgi:hypothetical protein